MASNKITDERSTVSSAKVSCCGRFWAKLTRRKVIREDLMKTELDRILTPLAVVMIGIGQMSGGGAFVVLGPAAQLAGPGVVLSFAIGGIVAFTTGICYAEFAATIPRAGSGYLFSYVTLGEFVAFIVGWQVILEEIISVSSMCSAISGAIDAMTDRIISNYSMTHIAHFDHPLLAPSPDFLAFAIGLACVLILLLGVRNSIFTSNILNGIQLVVIVFCIVAGFSMADFSNWTAHGFLPNGFRGVMAGAASSFYAYIGFEGVACAGEETLNPQKTIPMAMFTSLGIMMVLYLFQASALTLMVPYYDIDTQSAFPEAFEQLGYSGIGGAVAMGIIIGLVGGLINSMYTMTRIIYAMANDGLLFRAFGIVNKRTKTPLFGEIFFGIFAASLAIIFNVEILVEFLSVGTLLAYTIVAGSSIILHYQSRVTVYDRQRMKHLAIESYDTPEDEAEAGKLKERFRWLACLPSPYEGFAVDLAVLLFAVFVGLFFTVFIYLYEEIIGHKWWAVLIIGLCALAFVMCYLVIVAHKKRRLQLPYEIPSVPFIPALSVALNVLLLANLSATTWARMLIWLGLGLLIYFTYGIRNSVLEHQEDDSGILSDTEMVDPDIVRDPNLGQIDTRAVGVHERTPLIRKTKHP